MSKFSKVLNVIEIVLTVVNVVYGALRNVFPKPDPSEEDQKEESK